MGRNQIAYRHLLDLHFRDFRVRRERVTEILDVHHLADLDLRLAVWGKSVRSALHPLDRFFQRFHLNDREARNELFRLGERTIDDSALVTAELHARTLRARGEPLGGEEDASLYELFVVLAHRGERFWLRENARSDSFVALPMIMKRIVLS